MLDIDLSPQSSREKSEEEFYLFRPTTVGLNKVKKSKAFPSLEDAISAGQALNILEGTPDKIFIILKSSQINCFTNITNQLPFSNAFFRYPRLSDSANKFKSQSSPVFNRSEFSMEQQNLLAGLSINEPHPALQINKNSLEGKKIHEIYDLYGLTKANIQSLQSLIHYHLGISSFKPEPDPDVDNLFEISKIIFPSLKDANKFISSHVMTRFANWGQDIEGNRIFIEE